VEYSAIGCPRMASMSSKEIVAAIAVDEAEAVKHIDCSNVSIELTFSKAALNMRIDYEVLEFTRSQGNGYQK